MTDPERQLLERLAAEGKPTRLLAEELQTAKSLEKDGLILLVRGTLDAVITPKGRHVLAGIEIGAQPGKEIGGGPAKKPFGFMD